MKQLGWLGRWVARASPTAGGSIYLVGLPQLKMLSLQNTAVTDDGLLALGRLSSLRWLNPTGSKVTPAGIAALEDKLPELEVVENDR